MLVHQNRTHDLIGSKKPFEKKSEVELPSFSPTPFYSSTSTLSTRAHSFDMEPEVNNKKIETRYRLFIGRIVKKLSFDDIRNYFLQFGALRDL